MLCAAPGEERAAGHRCSGDEEKLELMTPCDAAPLKAVEPCSGIRHARTCWKSTDRTQAIAQTWFVWAMIGAKPKGWYWLKVCKLIISVNSTRRDWVLINCSARNFCMTRLRCGTLSPSTSAMTSCENGRLKLVFSARPTARRRA